ncbi:hypothetical protein [Pseudomonas sp. P9(2020)]|uniref:hypothetical protein n=1 Tax=Pseudomonas sp. P9(2020) TaxID=2763316 RepID=UPI001B33A6C5|nr:hypothetical protein [Pseudomonas sp. P9(2020)]MBP5947933.1 hypothetical protein [Pseudomonas sp. P9(2020)]
MTEVQRHHSQDHWKALYAKMEAERNAIQVELVQLRETVSTELRQQILHMRREVVRQDRSPLRTRLILAERVTSLLSRWTNGPTTDQSTTDAAHQVDLLGQALGECISAAGIIRPDANLTGPELLMLAQDLKSHLETSRQQMISSSEAALPLADRMKAAGMIPIDELMASSPLDVFMVHNGVNTLETFGQWLEMKRREYVTMHARFTLDKREDDELFEWVVAHAAVFGEVMVNFKAANSQTGEGPSVCTSGDGGS